MTTHTDNLLAALGPLAKLYQDPNVLEIMVDSPDKILVERGGHLEIAEVSFPSAEAILDVVHALLALENETLKPGESIVEIRFPGSEARGLAVLPPVALQGPCLVIRKLMNIGWISWEKLLEFGSITPEALDFLKQAVGAQVNILMAGGTGAGKTTVANRIGELINPEARLVIVEKIHELQIRHPRAVYLETAGQPNLSIQALIQTGAKMRPDWLILGELQGPEAMTALEVLSSGYSGMTTMHANSLEDALMRLEAMCLTASMGLGLVEIRNRIAAALQLVCYQKRLPDGKRKIVDIAEIRGVENGQLVFERIFHYNTETGRLEATGLRASWQ